MKEKKNNALEKVEKITEKYSGKRDVSIDENFESNESEERERIDKALEKREEKEEKKRQKELKKEYKKKGKKSEKTKWLKVAVVGLSIATIALASVLTYTYVVPSGEKTALENSYRRNYYDVVAEVDNMDLYLSKALLTKDEEALQEYFTNIAINSELAESNLQSLPLMDENRFYTAKLVNQIGDYSKYLNKKLINGEPLSISDKESLRALYNANLALRDTLYSINEEMGNDFSFISINENSSDLLKGKFDELQNMSVEYPELIYDGPFSDGVNQREIKGLKGEEISRERAQEIFCDIFKDMDLKDVDYRGELTSDITCYNFSGKKGDNELFAEISKVDGKLIMFDYTGSCGAQNIDLEQAEITASGFLQGLNIANMKPVWTNLSNNAYTINFAYVDNGIIVYSDLIKVRVCAETNSVIGIEASSYYTNHTKREIGSAKITEETAREKMSEDIDVLAVRLVLIPIGTKTEKLCYEFYGLNNDETYYVYIDALNGKQAQMFKVIDSTEGLFLM